MPQALFDGSGHSRREAFAAYTVQAFDTAGDVMSWTAVPAAVPAIVPSSIVVAGTLFQFDPADTTTAHDGIWTCVSFDGKRYKATALPRIVSVESKSLTIPPALISAIYQKAWLVPAAATGAWAGHDDDIAVATGRGWLFVPPRIGLTVYVSAEPGFYHYSVAGSWISGLGAPSNGTVTAANLEWPFGLIVEDRITTTPPVGASKLAYIVGPSATGAWAGQDGKVAIGPLGGWVFLAPPEGGSVYVKAEGREVRRLGGAWTANVVSPLLQIKRAADAASLAISGAYSYSGTAPISGNTTEETLFVTLQASSGANIIEIEYQANVDLASAGTVTAALFLDASSSAVDWKRKSPDATETDIVWKFWFAAPDTASHTYRIRLAGSGAVAKRNLIIKEYAA